MNSIPKHRLFLFLFSLLIGLPGLHAQSEPASSEPVSGLLKIKTNPLQYLFRRANISVEVDIMPRTSIELKAESFPGIPSLYTGIVSNFPIFGSGYGGHLMLRRYNAKHHWFISGGLSLKQWSYDSLRYYPDSFNSDFALRCTAQSETAWVPGIKALGGIQYNLPNAPITIEAYTGFGVKFRISRNDIHLLGPEDLGPNYPDCQGLNPQGDISSNSVNILGSLFLGGNIGFDLMRKKK